MSRGNEFGIHEGLNIIPGTVEKIDIEDEDGRKLRIPLIGWYPLSPPESQDRIRFAATPLEGAHPDAACYFVQPYSVHPTSSSTVLATVEHGGKPVTAAIQQDNAIGFQFHPEHSSAAGLSLLNRFLEL